MAEVKVRITAQNETQTGFQSALQNAKKFGAEASRAASVSIPTPAAAQRQAGGGAPQASFKDIYEDAIQKAEANIEANLAKRKAAREAAANAEKQLNQESASGAMGTLGRFAALATAAVTVGKVISMAFEQVSNAFKNAAETSKQLASAIQQAGSAMSSGGSVAGFKQINALADQLEKTRKETFGNNFGEAFANLLQGRPGQIGARLADLALTPFGMSGSAELGAQAEQARVNAREMLIGSLARQATNAGDLLGTGGDAEAIKRMQREQQNAAEIDQARQALDPTGNNNANAERAIALIKERQAAEAALAEQIKKRAAEERQAEARGNAMEAAQNQAMANQVAGMTPEERLAFNRRGLQDLEGFAGAEVELKRQQILGEILRLEEQIKNTRESAISGLDKQIENREFAGMSQAEQQAKIQADQQALLAGIQSGEISAAEASQRAVELASRQDALANGGFQGSAGASAFQRVGLATNEFFDTRKAKDPATAIEKGNKLLQQIKEALSKGEPLVLNPSSS
jgi:hypothetical protein